MATSRTKQPDATSYNNMSELDYSKIGKQLEESALENQEMKKKVAASRVKTDELMERFRLVKLQVQEKLNNQASTTSKYPSQYNHSSPVLLKAQPYTQQQTFSATTDKPSQVSTATYSARR